MTGIAGLIGMDGRPATESDLRDVMDLLAPLGPAGEGSWAGAVGPMGTALGAARRLRVPEDDADTQPVTVSDGQIVVVADVVLTNRPELCRLLALPDSRDVPDSTVVTHAYLRWGENCAERLRGEFAFAVADRRRGGVLLARDHTGCRPLHVHRGRGWLGFATTALAVTGFAGVAAELDLERAKEFLALIMETDRSWVRDVTPVPPATALWISPAGVRSRRYWNPVAGRRRGSAEEHAEELRTAMDDATRAQSRRRGAIGVMLSGGLDSTTVAATVAEQVAPEPVRTYTSVPPPGWTGPPTSRDPDESRLVRTLAARHPNLHPAFVDVRGATMIDGDDEIFAAGGVPVRNTTNMTWIRDIHRRAADDGVSVLFSGSVGNNSFSRDGRRWLVELLANGRPAEAWREARAWSAARDQPLTSTIRNSVLGEMAPAWVRRWRATRRGDPPRVAAWLAGTALRPELHADVDLTAHPAITPGYRDSPIAAIGRHAPHSEVQAAQGARWDLRHADPTADVAVLEVCLRQPDWAQRHRGLSRAAARAAMRDRVPDEIRLRNVRGAQLPDWYDRLTDARLEITQELAAARADPSSRALIDLDRLELLVRQWPTPAQAGARARPTEIGSLLPRALAVSRYLRWFDAWAREQRAARLSGR